MVNDHFMIPSQVNVVNAGKCGIKVVLSVCLHFLFMCANNKTFIKSLFRSISKNITFVLHIALDLRSRAISRSHVIFLDIELTTS